MNRREVVFIVARASDGTIALDGDVPWKISADLRRFKRLTMGMPMVMGRKTFESLPGLLPGRRHIVLTRNRSWSAEGVEVAHSVEEAVTLVGDGSYSVIGGAEIFAMFDPLATRFELTEVFEETDGEVKMPAPGAAHGWRERFREEHEAADGWPPYAFVTLVREA